MKAAAYFGSGSLQTQRVGDWLAVAVAVCLPWSTSATAICIALWVIHWVLTSRPRGLRDALATAAGALPALLWFAALIGMFWSDAPWAERLDGLRGFHKLLVIPLLLAHFQRPEQVRKVVVGFVVSCTALLIVSWLYVLWPNVAPHTPRFPGVPVRDYHAQGTEFVLCALGLLHLGFDMIGRRRHRLAAALFALGAVFLANVLYVATSRTELVVLPLLFAIFGLQRFGWKGGIATLVLAGALTSAVWATSPYFRERVVGIKQELELGHTGQSERLTFYRKSLAFIQDAPLFGHGTGAMAQLFRKAAEGQSGVDAIPTDNPHNQVFAIAIQLGLFGTILLIAMWMAHAVALWQAGRFGWLGVLVVVENMGTGVFNTHLFDFVHGWIYVFGVGVIGGIAMRHTRRRGPPPAREGVPQDRGGA